LIWIGHANAQRCGTVEIGEIRIAATGKSVDVDKIAEAVVRLAESQKSPTDPPADQIASGQDQTGR
jgi:hypothetical protein